MNQISIRFCASNCPHTVEVRAHLHFMHGGQLLTVRPARSEEEALLQLEGLLERREVRPEEVPKDIASTISCCNWEAFQRISSKPKITKLAKVIPITQGQEPTTIETARKKRA